MIMFFYTDIYAIKQKYLQVIKKIFKKCLRPFIKENF